jgi:hypothetical protein
MPGAWPGACLPQLPECLQLNRRKRGQHHPPWHCPKCGEYSEIQEVHFPIKNSDSSKFYRVNFLDVFCSIIIHKAANVDHFVGGWSRKFHEWIGVQKNDGNILEQFLD